MGGKDKAGAGNDREKEEKRKSARGAFSTALRRDRNRLFIAWIITGFCPFATIFTGRPRSRAYGTDDFIAIARPEGIYGKGCVISAAKTLLAGAWPAHLRPRGARNRVVRIIRLPGWLGVRYRRWPLKFLSRPGPRRGASEKGAHEGGKDEERGRGEAKLIINYRTRDVLLGATTVCA